MLRRLLASLLAAFTLAACGSAAQPIVTTTSAASPDAITSVSTPSALPAPSPSTTAPAPVAAPLPTRARSHAPQPPRSPAESLCGAPQNPYHFNLCGRGSLVYSPPSDICSYFDCIPNFPNGKGYMVECNDGMYSMSGGRQGACSYHHGEGTAVTRG